MQGCVEQGRLRRNGTDSWGCQFSDSSLNVNSSPHRCSKKGVPSKTLGNRGTIRTAAPCSEGGGYFTNGIP